MNFLSPTPFTRKGLLEVSLIATAFFVGGRAEAAGIEIAGDLLVDLRADHESAGMATWENTGSLGDFNLVENGVAADPETAEIDGVPYVRLDPDDNYLGPLAPSEIAGSNTRSVEVWVKNDQVANEEVMVAWGRRGSDFRNYAFSYGTNATWGALGGWGGGDVPWFPEGGAPAEGQLHHLVITYDGTDTRLYADGVETNARTHSLNTFDEPNNIVINAAREGDNTVFQRPNSGEMDYSVIRIHSEVLTPEQVTANFEEGWAGVLIEGAQWTGASGSDWGDSGNWEAGSVPLAEEIVSFGLAGSGATVDLGAEARTQAGVVFEADVTTTIDSTGSLSLTLDGGAEPAVIGGAGTHALDADLVLASETDINLGGESTALTLSGEVSGPGGFEKRGTGSLVFDGAGTFAGAASVVGGSLLVNGSLASPVAASDSGTVGGAGDAALDVTLSSGGTLRPGAPGAGDAMALGDLTVSSGGALTFEFGAENDSFAVNGTLTLGDGAVRLVQEGSDTVFDDLGSYELATFANLVGDASGLVVANATPGRNYVFTTDNNTLTLVIEAGPVWDGGADPITDWSDPLNWGGVPATNGSGLVFAASPTAPASDNDLTGGSFTSLTFEPSASAYELTGNPIALTGNPDSDVLTNSSVQSQTIGLDIDLPSDGNVRADGAPVVISGSVSGSGKIVKSGPEALILSGGNSFAGGVEVTEGLLNLGSAGALGSGPLVLSGTGVANLSGGPLALTSDNDQNWSDTVNFGGDAISSAGTVTLDDSTTLVLDAPELAVGAVQGDSPLIKQGPGSLVLNGPGSSFPRLEVAGGKVLLSEEGPSVALTGGDSLGIRLPGATFEMSGGTLDLAGRWRFANDGGVGAATIDGGVINHTGGDLDIAFNGGNAALTFAGDAVYDGTGRLVKLSEAWQAKSFVTVEDNAVVTFGETWVGAWNAVGSTLNAANLTVSGNAMLTVDGELLIGREAGSSVFVDAQFNQHGGTTDALGTVRLANDQRDAAFLKGTLNLAGGRFAAPELVAGNGIPVVNFRGGELAYNGAGPSSDFIVLNLDGGIFVYEGAVIDTGSEDVTIFESLLAPIDDGVASIEIAEGGSGYQDVPPTIHIDGGLGVGATAEAVVDSETGAVTGITINSPGSGFLIEPFVTLEGGSGTGAVLDEAIEAVALASNESFVGGLTKTGSGTLTLFGENTYRGDTVVQDGTLSIIDEDLADSSTVRIASGAVLDLNHTVTDTVTRLFIGGIQQTDGTWGSMTSDADNKTERITGDGTLLVLEAGSGVSPFQTWAADPAFGLASEDQGPDADPDGDGVSNLLEFALNGDPADPADRGLARSLTQASGGGAEDELTLVAAVRRGAAFAAGPGGSQTASIDGLTYTVEGSLSLGSFDSPVSVVGSASDTAPAATGLPSLEGEDWEYRTFRLDASQGLPDQGFLRIGVE